MEIENLTFGGGLNMTTVNPPPAVTDQLVLQFIPESLTSPGSWVNTQGNSSSNGTIYGIYSSNSLTGLTTINQSFVTIPSIPEVTAFSSVNSYTVELWFNPSTMTGLSSASACLIRKGDKTETKGFPYDMTYSTTFEQIYVSWVGTNSYSPPGAGVTLTNKPANSWYQLVGVYNWLNTNVQGTYNQSLSVFCNGVKEGEVVGGCPLGLGNMTGNTSEVGIGSLLGWTEPVLPYYFYGQIGILRLYKKALTSDEILQNFQADRTRFGI